MSGRNIRLIVEYDGTAYSGWQRQPSAVTVQGTLEERIRRLCGHSVDLLVAGRTDAGVHALGQTANFHTNSSLTPRRMRDVLNQMLPHDIRVARAEEVPPAFHATYHAKSKLYRYTIRNTPDYTVFDRNYYHHVRLPLDLAAMRKATRVLEGTHDFSSFRGALGKRADPKRTLIRVRIKKEKNDVVIDYLGESFLHQMVRILSGTLLYVGLGKLLPGDVPVILRARDRRKAGPTLPPQGLCLVKVYYPKVFPPVRKKREGLES